LDFEKAASIHAKIQKVEAVAALVSEAVHPLAQLHAILIQPSSEAGHVALFQLTAGVLTGPAQYDTFGMRLHNEQSGSSSLYTHPYALEAVPLQEGPSARASTTAATVTKPNQISKDTPRDVLEQRLTEALDQLHQFQSKTRPDIRTIADHLSLFTRWYHRPEAKRIGEAIFYTPDETLPSKGILRAISRVFRGAVSDSPGPTT
jgi:excinuclease ABC subunit C